MVPETPHHRPKVSIFMLAYNHEKFIEQAIRSGMMQQADFDFEMVIGEDVSTDSTRAIVERLRDEFPDRIRPILHEKNVGMVPNFISVYNACRGDYIAFLDGDDYWIAPDKMQQQADYLDAHPDCVLCFHDAEIIHDYIGEAPDEYGRPPVVYPTTFATWRQYGYMVSGTVMFRRPAPTLPDWFSRMKASGDYPLFVWLLSGGGAMHYIPTIMSAYRKHEGGITYPARSIAHPQYRQRMLYALHDIDILYPLLGPEYQKSLDIDYNRYHAALARSHHHAGNNEVARLHLWQSVRYLTFDLRLIYRTLDIFLMCYLPFARRILNAAKDFYLRRIRKRSPRHT